MKLKSSAIGKKSLLLSALSAGVAVMLLGYSAYGWFSMSREVRAVGMRMDVSVPLYLEISATGTPDDFHHTVEVDLADIVAAQTAGSDNPFVNGAGSSFYLLPASSFEGLSVWQTDTANIDGSAKCAADEFENVSEGLPQNPGRVQYRPLTKTFEGYYIDVPLWLRTPAMHAPLGVRLSETLTAITGDADSKSIVRMAFLNGDASGICYGSAPLVYKDVLSPSNCAQVVTAGTPDPAVSRLVAPQFLSFTDPDWLITELNNGNNLTPGTAYNTVKLTVRIWIEGQDSNCRATLLNQTRVFKIDIGFAIKDN